MYVLVGAVTRAMLWQVLEELGVYGRILSTIKSVRTQQHSSAVITRHFCHLHMSHGGEAMASAESNSVWFVY